MTTDRQKTIAPEKWYTVIQAARLLGVHRCTLYSYIKYWAIILLPERSDNGAHFLIKGENIIKFKEKYRAKKGRKQYCRT